MKFKNNILFLLIVSSVIGYGFIYNTSFEKEKIIALSSEIESQNLVDIEIAIGGERPNHYMKDFDPELAKAGELLIKEGKASYNGKNGSIISPYFNCTDCHNLVKETESLTDLDPQHRLDYLVKNKLPYTPGSTFYGIYNRTSFYNDDYDKKYGALVIDARDTLENAIQLCAEYCASGRPLVDWELNAIMHYYKSHELKIKDLNLSNSELTEIKSSVKNNQSNKKVLEALQAKYIQAYGATFTGAKSEANRKYGEGGDVENGKKIYESGCMYCHKNKRVTFLNLDDDVLSGKYLWSHRKGYDDLSIYQVVRWGTYPIIGRQQYMPLYTKEKMSDQQLEDLMSYVKELAKE
jgi:mono/diheme cytochrome c family protein